jgi:hypothetical protein
VTKFITVTNLGIVLTSAWCVRNTVYVIHTPILEAQFVSSLKATDLTN